MEWTAKSRRELGRLSIPNGRLGIYPSKVDFDIRTPYMSGVRAARS